MVISVDDAQRQFAFVKGNRPVNVRAVKQKEKSMKAYGQLTPITVTDGERVIQMGGRLVDLKGNEIPDGDAGKYYAVLDGQHRLVAYQNLGLDLNDLVICEPLNAELSITEIIAQMNICTTVWKKSDYMAAPAMMLKEANEVFDFAMFLHDSCHNISLRACRLPPHKILESQKNPVRAVYSANRSDFRHSYRKRENKLHRASSSFPCHSVRKNSST